MESKLMDLVKAMHEKFGLENTKGVLHLTKEEKEFRSPAMLEELNEYIAADTLVDQYDALLDLIVFAVGTLERHGFPLLAGFEKVMEANMAKELGQNGEKRGGFKRDLVKPEGWTAPEAKLQLILDSKSNTQVVFDFAPSSDGNIVAGFAPKFDAAKVRVDLLPIDPMMQIATVFGFGAKKYFTEPHDSIGYSTTIGISGDMDNVTVGPRLVALVNKFKYLKAKFNVTGSSIVITIASSSLSTAVFCFNIMLPVPKSPDAEKRIPSFDTAIVHASPNTLISLIMR